MNIIRDDEMSGLMMIPLLHQWGVKRCNVSKCCEKPTTIITGVINKPIGLCENHFNECKKNGKLNYTLHWCKVEDENK